MRGDWSIRATAVLLCLSILAIQTLPCYAEARDLPPKPRVAFIGMYFENVPENVRDSVIERLQRLLSTQEGLAFVPPEEVKNNITDTLLERAIRYADQEAFLEIASKLDLDYVYGGNLANQSRTPSRVLLVGELYRADRKLGILNRFEMATYLEHLGEDLATFQKEYVKTAVPAAPPKKTLWPWLVVAGVAIAGIIAMTLTSSRFGAEGQPGQTEPIKP